MFDGDIDACLLLCCVFVLVRWIVVYVDCFSGFSVAFRIHTCLIACFLGLVVGCCFVLFVCLLLFIYSLGLFSLVCSLFYCLCLLFWVDLVF